MALGRGAREFSVTEIMLTMGWKKSKAYEVLNRAEELGCIAEGEKRGRYSLLRHSVETPLNLPDKIYLAASDFRISTTGSPS
jgi:DNA-binding IclR family transcriptional regulator